MNQLRLFEAVETLHVVDAEPIQYADWKPYDRQLTEYYGELPDVTDPDADVRLTWNCPTRYGKNGYMTCSTCSAPVKLSDLNPDIIYCRHATGTYQQKGPLPCWSCARKVADFLKLFLP